MFRISFTIVAIAFWANAGVLCAFGQEAPPPEGPPQAGNPYAQPLPGGPATASAPNPAMLAQAKSWFARLQSGNIDRSKLASGSYAAMTEATISNAQKMVGSLGKPVSFVQQQATTQGSVSAAVYVVTFKNGRKVDFFFAVDGQGKVEGLALGTPR